MKPDFPAIGTRLTVVLIPGGRKIPNCWTGSGSWAHCAGHFLPCWRTGTIFPCCGTGICFALCADKATVRCWPPSTGVTNRALFYCLEEPGRVLLGRADGGQLAAEEGAILLYES